MNPIKIPENFNYIGVFLTFDCNQSCKYCINHQQKLVRRKSMPAQDWVKALNRIQTRPDLPISLQGGEPTLNPIFYYLVNRIKTTTPLDLLTNLNFDPKRFMRYIPPGRFSRTSPYASIRASFHRGQVSMFDFLDKVRTLKHRGYDIGVWEIDHPYHHVEIKIRQGLFKLMGIDYRLKEYLGPLGEKFLGSMKYAGACTGEYKPVTCKPSELLIGPGGYMFRCHRNLYANENNTGHILDLYTPRLDKWRECSNYGSCNPCDIKVKFNRFQEEGHCAVRIHSLEMQD